MAPVLGPVQPALLCLHLPHLCHSRTSWCRSFGQSYPSHSHLMASVLGPVQPPHPSPPASSASPPHQLASAFRSVLTLPFASHGFGTWACPTKPLRLHPPCLCHLQSKAGKHSQSSIFAPSIVQQKPQSTPSVFQQPNSYCHEHTSHLCAKFVTHLFACSDGSYLLYSANEEIHPTTECTTCPFTVNLVERTVFFFITFYFLLYFLTLVVTSRYLLFLHLT